jgi:predicted RNase H-like HicB family nuclease
MQYTAVIEKTDDGWYLAHCVQVPNAHTQGRTIEEAKENLEEAVALILDCEKEIAIRRAEKTDFSRKVTV